MGKSLKSKLDPIKNEVLKAVKERGRRAAMQEFGIKTYTTFSKWLYKTTHDPHFGIEHNKLAGMSGGVKNKWLRENREHIIWYFETFGKEKTEAEFYLTHDTLGQLLRGGHEPRRYKLSKPDEAIGLAQAALDDTEKLKTLVEMYHDQVVSLRGEVRELKDLFSKFVPMVAQQLGEKAIIPLLERLIQVDNSLNLKPQPDPLSLHDLPGDKPMLKAPKQPYDVIIEAEAVASQINAKELFSRMQKMEVEIYHTYWKACEEGDWQYAIQLILLRNELSLIERGVPYLTSEPEDSYYLDEESFVDEAKEWMAEVERLLT